MRRERTCCRAPRAGDGRGGQSEKFAESDLRMLVTGEDRRLGPRGIELGVDHLATSLISGLLKLAGKSFGLHDTGCLMRRRL